MAWLNDWAVKDECMIDFNVNRVWLDVCLLVLMIGHMIVKWMVDYTVDWMTDWMTEIFIEWIICHEVDNLNWLNEWMIGWRNGRMIEWMVLRMNDWWNEIFYSLNCMDR